MQTNSTIHQRIEPLLYEHIEWNIEKTYEKPTIHQFLSKLLIQPEVGLWVRSFTMIGRFNQKTYEYEGLARHVVEELIQRASNNHQDLFDGFDEEWWSFYASSPVMLLSLLLLLCPNITNLTPWSGYSEPPHRLLFLSRAISSLPRLKTLTYATAFSKFPNIPWTDESLAFIFRLPTLRSLTLQVTEDSRHGSHPSTLPLAPQITTLTLHSSVLSSLTIQKLLAKLPAIRNLSLHLLRETHPSTPDTIAAGSFIDCPTLASSLSQTSQTLERLTIKSDFYFSRETHRNIGGSYASGRDGNTGTLRYWGTKDTLSESLRSFPKLRYLEIDPVLLLGWDITNQPNLRAVLPTGLRTLKLRADFIACKDWRGRIPWVRDLMRDFFDGGAGDGFEALVLQVLESHAARYVKEVGELKGMCEERVVMFGIEKLLG